MDKIILSLIVLLMACVPAYAQFQGSVATQPYLYKFSSGATVTTVKSSSGFLHSITVTGGTTSPIDIYDGSATTLNNQIASFTTTNALQTYFFDVSFASGCTVSTNNTSLKYTVSYL